MSAKGSSVIQTMLKRLAEEEQQYKKAKATGIVDAAKSRVSKAASY
jgi:ribosomal protein S20